jgi:GTPase Era involved in 16S rRNA processing
MSVELHHNVVNFGLINFGAIFDITFEFNFEVSCSYKTQKSQEAKDEIKDLIHDDKVVKVILIGNGGIGKSSLVNKLCGTNIANIGAKLSHETRSFQVCVIEDEKYHKGKYIIIDCPGIDIKRNDLMLLNSKGNRVNPWFPWNDIKFMSHLLIDTIKYYRVNVILLCYGGRETMQMEHFRKEITAWILEKQENNKNNHQHKIGFLALGMSKQSILKMLATSESLEDQARISTTFMNNIKDLEHFDSIEDLIKKYGPFNVDEILTDNIILRDDQVVKIKEDHKNTDEIIVHRTDDGSYKIKSLEIPDIIATGLRETNNIRSDFKKYISSLKYAEVVLKKGVG